MPRGGKRTPGEGKSLGRPKVKAEQPTHVNKSVATDLIAALIRPASEDEKLPIAFRCEVLAWRPLWDASDLRIRLDTRKFLYEKRDGKAVHTVNHLYDKPLQVNATLELGEGMRKAMQKAEERLGQCKRN